MNNWHKIIIGLILASTVSLFGISQSAGITGEKNPSLPITDNDCGKGGITGSTGYCPPTTPPGRIVPPIYTPLGGAKLK